MTHETRHQTHSSTEIPLVLRYSADTLFAVDALELGAALRARRRALGLTQLDAAELAGVGERFVHEVETGSGNPGLQGVHRLCRALGLEIMVVPR